MKRNALLCLAVLVLTQACGPSPADVTATAEMAAAQTQTAVPTETPTPTPLPTAAPNAFEDILFEDDFSDPGSGWPDGAKGAHVFSYQNGSYSMLVAESRTGSHSSNDLVSYPDVQIDVDAVKASEANAALGLICRVQDDTNFYAAVIVPTGDFFISELMNDDWQVLKQGSSAPKSHSTTSSSGAMLRHWQLLRPWPLSS